MDLRKTWLVLYILLIFHLQHNFPSVNSKPSSIDTYYESLHPRATKPDVVDFERKDQELVVVIKKEGGGGWRGGGGGSTGIGGGRGWHGLLGWRGGGIGIGGGGGWRGWRGWRGGSGGTGIGGGGGWRGWRGGGGGGGGGGGLPGGGGGSGGGLPGGRGGSTGKGGVGPLIPISMQTGDRGTHRSSSSRNIRGGVCVVCWLSLLVLVDLLLV
ncbi:BnaC06g05080D [Brassica napus]|uniref:Uncharacterized protein n=2 Tax=Brassica TaxID=3705 RepID=A0A0D3CQ44_BRAOL|nr:PREDICTED: glycine-rich cell wall structural protein 1-like [Brassica oleracea var. oleracea]CAF2055408.1 unnamed protein product [Brassica napus]CDY33845.1 BnaC06g05080D [Brassica napus]